MKAGLSRLQRRQQKEGENSLIYIKAPAKSRAGQIQESTELGKKSVDLKIYAISEKKLLRRRGGNQGDNYYSPDGKKSH